MRLALLCALSALAGCAAPAANPPHAATQDEPADRYERLNRKFFAINGAIDRATLKPVASLYRDRVPSGVRTPVHNLLVNIANPVQFANDVLEAKPRRAGDTFMRFLINTSVGGLGLFDVATGWGYPDHGNDLGITLALWGVPDGPFLFLPVLGPTNPRDAVGFGASAVLDPFTWVSFGGSATFGISRYAVGAVDARSRVLSETDAIDKTALDPYATYRSLYQQHRGAEIQKVRDDTAGTLPDWISR